MTPDPAVAASPRRAPILPIFLIVVVDVFGMTLVLPLLAFYAERFGASKFEATLLFSVYAAFQLISSPQLGHLSDQIGRKPMLILSQVGTLIGFIMLARANTLWVIFLARIIDGATAGNLSIAQAYIADHTDPKNRAKSFAIIGIAFGLGFFVGPMLAGIMAHHYGLAAPIWLAAAMSAISILCTATLLQGGKPEHHDEAPAPSPLPSPAAAEAAAEGAETGAGPAGRRLSVMDWNVYVKYFRVPVLGARLFQFLAYMICFSMFITGFALFAEARFHWTEREVGYFFGYMGFLGIIWQGGLVGRLVARFGEARLVRAGFISLIIAYFGVGLTHTLTGLALMAAISSFGNSVLRPALSSLITQRVSRREHGVVLGLTTSLNSVASVVAPAIAGLLIQHGRLELWAWGSCLAALVGLFLASGATHASETHQTA